MITSARLAERLNVQKRTIERNIKSLKEKHILGRKGSDKEDLTEDLPHKEVIIEFEGEDKKCDLYKPRMSVNPVKAYRKKGTSALL